MPACTPTDACHTATATGHVCVRDFIPDCCAHNEDCTQDFTACNLTNNKCELIVCTPTDACHTASVVNYTCVQEPISNCCLIDSDCQADATCTNNVCTPLNCVAVNACNTVMANNHVCVNTPKADCCLNGNDSMCTSVPLNYTQTVGGWWHLGLYSYGCIPGAVTGTCGICEDADNDGVCSLHEASCNDGRDGDHDGLTDCQDPDCTTSAYCSSTPTCTSDLNCTPTQACNIVTSTCVGIKFGMRLKGVATGVRLNHWGEAGIFLATTTAFDGVNYWQGSSGNGSLVFEAGIQAGIECSCIQSGYEPWVCSYLFTGAWGCATKSPLPAVPATPAPIPALTPFLSGLGK